MQAPAELTLYRHAETAWAAVIRPWLEASRDLGLRSWFVVPTRGQAHAWKQRCIEAGVTLLGIEFLTPGLARQKWVAAQEQPKPVLGRELLLFVLRDLVEERLSMAIEEDARALLTSLRSDLDVALDDYDRLLRSGHGAAGFPWGPLRDIFQELEARVETLGYELGPVQARHAAANVPTAVLRARLLVMGMGVESWGEFDNVIALGRLCAQVHVLIPEPEFRGKRELDERWVERWEAALGVNALTPDLEDPEEHCGGAVEGWLPKSERSVPFPAEQVSVSVGLTREEEAEAACDQVDAWLRSGASQIALVFPRAGAALSHVARGLKARAIDFIDHVGQPVTVSRETRMQRALITLWKRGGRWDDLLLLWPHLLSFGFTTLSLPAMRKAVESWHDETQCIRILDTKAFPPSSSPKEWALVDALLPRLGLAWPEAETMRETWARVASLFIGLQVGMPAGWEALLAFAEKEARVLPCTRLLELLESFINDTPVESTAAANRFARVTLTTRRRGEGVPWSHLLLLEANTGLWPSRTESSCWLPDDARRKLNEETPGAFALFTADDLAWLEKVGYAALARDTRHRLVLSAARYDELEPEEPLSPNAWMERVLWRARTKSEKKLSLEALFAAATRTRREKPAPAPSGLTQWQQCWTSRRDPLHPFDEYFFSVDPAEVRPEVLPARVIEAGIKDPAELWFASVLGLRPVQWTPLQRERRKWIGQRVHQVLAEAFRAPAEEGDFSRRRPLEEVRGRALVVIARLREASPVDVYWDSCYKELEGLCLQLLDRLGEIELGEYVAVEVKLPKGAWVPLPGEIDRVGLSGRIDIVFSDRPSWQGARVDIFDFKTGSDKEITVDAMSRGRSLQLGLYLAAVRSLGVQKGSVRMLRPDHSGGEGIPLEEIDRALASMGQLEQHLRTGRYGALTPDPSEYGAAPLRLPLASVPVPAAVLKQKFAATFSASIEGDDADA